MVDSLLDAFAESESFPSSGNDDHDFSSFEDGGDSDLVEKEREEEARAMVSDAMDENGRKTESKGGKQRTVRAILGTFSTSLSKNRD